MTNVADRAAADKDWRVSRGFEKVEIILCREESSLGLSGMHLIVVGSRERRKRELETRSIIFHSEAKRNRT